MKNTYVYTLMILYGNGFFSVKVGIMGPGRAEGQDQDYGHWSYLD